MALSSSRIALASLFVWMAARLEGATLKKATASFQEIDSDTSVLLIIALLACGSDFIDGRVARRLGVASPSGARIDVLGDGVFIVAGLAAMARLGVVVWLAPVAVVLSLAAFARAAWTSTQSPSGMRSLADQVGHLAGVVNYALVVGAALVCSGWPADPSGRRGLRALCWAASWLVAALNLAPIFLRICQRSWSPRRDGPPVR